MRIAEKRQNVVEALVSQLNHKSLLNIRDLFKSGFGSIEIKIQNSRVMDCNVRIQVRRESEGTKLV